MIIKITSSVWHVIQKPNAKLLCFQLTFEVGDIIVPELPGPFTTILVKTKDGKKIPLFIADVAFSHPKHFGRFMGYDKPIDFKLSTADVEAAIQLKKAEESKKTK
jgi:hypothetical protein